jgi:hypothetical protein
VDLTRFRGQLVTVPVFESGMNAYVLIEFMRRLVKDAQRKVQLFLDNLQVHHAKVVAIWLEEHTHRIEVFYLPAYSSEQNLDEYLNCDLKAGVHSAKPSRGNEQLRRKATRHMRMLQRRSSRARKYFEHENIRYAA